MKSLIYCAFQEYITFAEMNGKIFLHIPGKHKKNTLFFDESQFVSTQLKTTGNIEVHTGWAKKTMDTTEKKDASFLEKAWFRKVTAPSLLKKSGADAVVGMDDKTPHTGVKPSMNIVLSAAQKNRTGVFTPDAFLATETNLPWLPAFPDPAAAVMEWTEREAIKEQLTEGKEFFLTLLDAHDKASLTQMLKAYSLFKQRQRTGLRWLFAGTEAQVAAFRLLTAAYKLRDHLTILALPTAVLPWQWIAAAYALVYFPTQKSWQLPLYNALAAGAPVITSNGYARIPGENGALLSTVAPGELSEAMKLIFKDEALRSRLIHNGLERALHFSHQAAREKINQWF
ncbi:MAG: glycosyltransferase [Chitinophagaceae bacterium]